LRTDSLVSSLGDDARQGFLTDIGHLVETKYRGIVSRNWLYEIITTQKATATSGRPSRAGPDQAREN